MNDNRMPQGTMGATTDEIIAEKELGLGLETTADSFEKWWDQISTEELSTQSILKSSVPESFQSMNESQEMVNTLPSRGGKVSNVQKTVKKIKWYQNGPPLRIRPAKRQFVIQRIRL